LGEGVKAFPRLTLMENYMPKKYNIAFVREVRNALIALENLTERANDESSQFKWTLTHSRDNLRAIVSTYDEVLNRDATEDQHYQPPLRDIKGEGFNG